MQTALRVCVIVAYNVFIWRKPRYLLLENYRLLSYMVCKFFIQNFKSSNHAR